MAKYYIYKGNLNEQILLFLQFKVDGTSFPDARSLVTTAHLTREICPRDLKYRKGKQIWQWKNYYIQGGFFLSVLDWIKTRVVV